MVRGDLFVCEFLMSNRLPRKDRMKDHPMFAPTCDDSGLVRDECTCPKCAEFREVMRERLKELKDDEDFRRREQSRRVDKEYVDRRMPYETTKRGWWE